MTEMPKTAYEAIQSGVDPRALPPKTEWNTEELRRDFEVKGFAMGFVVVKRRSDGVIGSLQFDHAPRRYFGFQEDRA